MSPLDPSWRAHNRNVLLLLLRETIKPEDRNFVHSRRLDPQMTP